MIRRGCVQKLGLATSKNGGIVYYFIKQKEIDEVSQKYPNNSLVDRVRTGMGIVKLLCVSGYRDAKTDIGRFIPLWRLSQSRRSVEQQKQYLRIKEDIIKAIPAFTLLFAPMGGPLFFLYMQLFPNLLPSWINTQSIHTRLQTLKLEQQIRGAVHFHKMFPLKDSQQLAYLISQCYCSGHEGSRNEMVRMVSCLLTGGYRDGTYYLTYHSPLKIFGWSWRYLLTASLSEWIMRFSLDQLVVNHPECRVKEVKDLSQKKKLQMLLAKALSQLSV